MLVAAADLRDEPELIAALQSNNDVSVVGRCVDLREVSSQGSRSGAEVILLSPMSVGRDPVALSAVRTSGLRILGISPLGADFSALSEHGVDVVELPPDPTTAAAVIAGRLEHAATGVWAVPPSTHHVGRGRVIAVWGPTGAPGRSFIANSLGQELSRHTRVMLIDADPYGGSLAISLGVADDVSGLAIACTHAHRGSLDRQSFMRIPRAVHGTLAVLTGITHPRRWPELSSIDQVLEQAREACDVMVVDTGFSLEDVEDAGRRNHSTLAVLRDADDVVAVVNADSVGMTRFAHAWPILTERCRTSSIHVVVNRSDHDPKIADVLHRVGITGEATFVPAGNRNRVAKALNRLVATLTG